MTEVAHAPTGLAPGLAPGTPRGRSTGRMRTWSGCSGQRIVELAQPKDSKVIWITSVGPRVQWGTQETLWPITKSALEANPSPRLEMLATPKKNFLREKSSREEFMYSCGRSSMIWEVSPLATQSAASRRLEQLAEPKQPPKEYKADRDHWVFSCGRSSPIWNVERAAVEAPDRQRTQTLSAAKRVHTEYLPNRDVKTVIPPTALRAKPTERLDNLSTPKKRDDGPFRSANWDVTDFARKAVPSGRCSELAKHKSIVEGYSPAREVIWSVPRSALRAGISTRVGELSQPIIRASMDHVQFDPDAFIVKENALKGRCSKRVEELAQPLNR